MIDGLMPYRAYRYTAFPWLPKVPESWDALSIRRLCRVFAGATPSRARPDYWLGGTIPWLASGDVNARRITGTSQFITEAGFAASSTKWIRPQSLVVALAGQGKTKGMVATVEVPATCNQSLGVLEPDLARLDHRFLAYYLESRYRDLRGLVGDGIRDGLNLDHLKSISMPVPPLEDQLLIVRFLDHADQRIHRYVAAKRKLIALLTEQRQAIIHEAVTRGLNPNVSLRASGVGWLGDVPQHWKIAPLKYLSRRIQNGSTPPSADPEYYQRGTTPWYGPSSCGHNELVGAPVRHLADAAFATGRARLIHGPALLVVVIGATAGRMALLGHDGSTNQQITSYELRTDRVNPYFALRQLRGAERWLRATASTATIPILDGGQVARLPVAIPPLAEQDQIGRHVDDAAADVNTALERAEIEISLLHEYRVRLVADVATGKLDVREAAANLPDEAVEPEPVDATDSPAEGEDEVDDADLDSAEA